MLCEQCKQIRMQTNWILLYAKAKAKQFIRALVRFDMKKIDCSSHSATLNQPNNQHLPTLHHNGVITVPSVQTVTSWRSTECPTVCSPPAPITGSERSETWGGKTTASFFPMAQKGWVLRTIDSHPFSASPKAWSSFHIPPHHKV